MEENYIDHETDALLEHLRPYFASEYLKKNFSREYLAKDKHEVETDHEYLEELSRFQHDGHEFPLPSLLDLTPSFTTLEKGGVLSGADLYEIGALLAASEDLYDLLYDKKEYFHLNDDALDLNSLPPLKRDITASIESDYTVSDNASPALHEVRNKIRSVEHSLSNIMNTYKNRYASHLSSATVTLKGGDEALPVKTSDKGYVKGSVISYSNSGDTLYMVPYEVIDLRNKLSSLKQEESTEVMKVLSDLSQKAAKQLKILHRDYEIYLTFDRYYAALIFGNSYKGSIAEMSEDTFELRSFFHPLLKSAHVITNSLTLGGKEAKALLITGPNAGGKSILIKAIALSVMMDKLGLLVPCLNGAKIPFLDSVFFLGGDNQSVLDNLSTFSSHLLGIKNITEKATPNSLVIIDEVGEGTSPKDGEALGVALLKYFEGVNCFTLLTSHFDGLKIYAASDPKCLTGAMEFNNDSLTPTYRLLLHTTGKSYGILLAKQMGIKESILKDAIAFERERSNQDTDALMEKLTEQVSENEKKARELDNAKKDLEKLMEKKQKAIDALNVEKESIKRKADSKVERLVDQRIEEINRIWEAQQGTKNPSVSYSQISQAKGELKKIKSEETPSLAANVKKEPLPELAVGDIVVDEDGQRAKVLEVKKKEVFLDLNGLRFRRSIEGLKKAKLTQADLKPKKSPNLLSSADMAYLTLSDSQGLECNIIGLHVDEAMRRVVSFLDSARLHKYGYVRIIHGAGTFALKNAVWKYLANHKDFVADYRLGGEGEGGLGATVVHLKV